MMTDSEASSIFNPFHPHSASAVDFFTKFTESIPRCAGCHEFVMERTVYRVLDQFWHSNCLRCNECGIPLLDKCFAKAEKVFCKNDFIKNFGTKCSACHLSIPSQEVVRKARDHIYHLDCFKCISCGDQLHTGDEFYLLDDGKLMCKVDFDLAKAKEAELDNGNKRPRTTITAKQLEALKRAYNESPKPARHIREQLSAETGLDMRVVQVWFQNRRAKEKRLKKDAGRQRWNNPYYHNSSNGPGSSRGDSDAASDDQSNEVHDLSYQSDIDSGSEFYGSVGGGGVALGCPPAPMVETNLDKRFCSTFHHPAMSSSGVPGPRNLLLNGGPPPPNCLLPPNIYLGAAGVPAPASSTSAAQMSMEGWSAAAFMHNISHAGFVPPPPPLFHSMVSGDFAGPQQVIPSSGASVPSSSLSLDPMSIVDYATS